MKIAFFTESYLPVVNGVATSVNTFARSLSQQGWEVHIFAPHYPGYTDPPGLKVHRTPSVVTPFARDYPIALPLGLRWGKFLEKEQFDIIHTQAPFGLGWSGVFWGRRYHIPLITTHHTLYTEYVHYIGPWFPHPLLRRMIRRWCALFCNLAEKVIVPTEVIKDLLISWGVKKPLYVLPTPVDLQTLQRATGKGVRERFCIPEEAFLILFVGRLAQEKNVRVLMETFSLISKEVPQAFLLILGSGPLEGECQRWANQPTLKERVRLAGCVLPPLRDQCYASADLFLYPSVTETQGMVLCEALAVGLPCVVADSMGAKAVVRHGVDGLRVPPQPEKMARAVIELFYNPTRLKEMSEQARIGAERFSIEKCTQDLIKIYSLVLGKRE